MQQASFCTPSLFAAIPSLMLLAHSAFAHAKKPARSACLLLALAGLVLALAPSASATVAPPSDTFTIQTATACAGSQQAQTSAGTICHSGTSPADYAPFSLAALQNGTQYLTSNAGVQTSPVYLVTNDTANSTFTLTYTGAVGASRALACQVSGVFSKASCGITGALGTALTGARYGPPATWPSPAVAQITFTGVAPGAQFNLSFASFTSADSGTLTGPCYGSCQVPVSCSGGTTTVTGTVYMPNGVDPLPNSLVYIPSTQPTALTAGVQCLQAGTPASGNPVAETYSGVDGTFTLTNVPTGSSIPIVIQSGKWRMQGTIQTVANCTNNVAPAWATTMPGSHLQGDMPKIALVTGMVDALECALLKTGIAQSEFTNPGGTGQVNLFKGSGHDGVILDGYTPDEETLVSSPATLSGYDMVMFPCQGAEFIQASGDLANVLAWANAGGRLFATHYSYVWLFGNPDPHDGLASAAKWNPGQDDPTPDPGMATVNTTFPGGSTLANWLQLSSIGASKTLGQIQISTLRLDQDGVVSPTQSWLTLNSNNNKKEVAHAVMQMTFNTPVGAPASAQCGRVLFNEYHVENSAYSLNGQLFPGECTAGPLTPQEHLLEYALFDLSTAITPVVAASATETFVNTPASFAQGDSADNLAILVANTSSTVNLSASLEVTGTLSAGITVNTASFVSGGWSCAATGSAFTCTRTTILAAGASDTINVPIAVAANAATGAGGSLSSTITGGGLPANVVGSDPLTVVGGHSISWATPAPITYGVALGATQLNASALYGGQAIPGSYSYLYGTTPVGTGTVLPAGTDLLSATFTPSDQSYPNQTTTASLVVNPAILTVTAANATRVYGAANPAFSASINGFVNGENSSVVSGSAALTTTATTSSPVGSYPIAAALGSLAATNYSFAFTPAALSVTQAPVTLTWPAPAAITAGTALSATQLDATAGTVAGSYTYSPAAGTVLPTGTQTLNVAFTPADATDYAAATATVQLVVNPAPVNSAVTLQFSNTHWTYPGTADTKACVTSTTSQAATGSMEIFDGSTLLTTQPLQGDGCAYWHLWPPLSAGSHILTATYLGDKNNPAGTSAPSTIVVAQAPVTIEASCWNTPAPYGADFQCNANTDSGTKKGYMTYSYDGGAAVVLQLNSAGATAFTFAKPPVGSHTLLIAYPQQGNYSGVTLPVQNFVVTPAPVYVALTPSSWYLNVGTPLSFTAAISSWSAGSPVSTGSVSFYDGATLLSTVPVNAAGVAVFTTTTLAAGTHTITGTYAGGKNYDTASTSIVLTTIAATPDFSQASGTFSAAQTVALVDKTPGAAIFYTTDGTVPTANSARYTAPLKVTSTVTIAAVAMAKGYKNSAVAKAKYTITPTAATPAFSLAAGTYASAQTVTITDSTPGAVLYYTTNGKAPTASSTRYAGAIKVSATETLQAIAIASGYNQSAVESARYTITPTAATPAFSLAAGTYASAQKVTITDSTPGAVLYYTTNGKTPTASSTRYSGAIKVSATETLQAIAIASGYSQSAVQSARYTIK